MRVKNLFISFISIPLLLSSCIFFSDDSWKEEYGTPELFFESVTNEDRAHVYKNDYNGDYIVDYGFAIKNMILESGPFVETNNKVVRAERTIIYEAYWQPATSGPNYCHLSLYEDGFIQILHKNSLGPYQYVYFAMDSLKANNIVDLVFNMEPNNN